MEESLFNFLFILLGFLNITHGQYGLFEYKGSPFSSVVTSPQLLEMCEEFEDFRDDDVIVLTFPKAGKYL